MGRKERYSQEFKESVVKKLLSRGSQTQAEFCEANNLALSSVVRWQSECGSVSGMKQKKTTKSKLSAENILKILSETYSLNEEDLGVYLRKNGLYASQLAEWRESFLTSMQPRERINKKDARDQKIQDLEKNLRKKDTALAEVSALLILQKKVSLLWPSPSEDEDV